MTIKLRGFVRSTLWTGIYVRSRDKLKSCFPHYQNTYGYQTWQVGYIQQGVSFHKATYLLSRDLVSNFDFSYTICRFRTQTPKSSLTSCLRQLLGLRKLRSSKKAEILQISLILRVTKWKNIIFYYGPKKQRLFLIFTKEIIFNSVELLVCAVIFKFRFNVNTNQTS